MKIIKFIGAFFIMATMLTSCYEEYVEDFDYTTVYFGTQKPLRTIVARDVMEFEVGVTLGGMRVDDGSYEVNFKVDTNLLNVIPEASGFKALPEAYYTLGNASSFNIIKDHMRVVNVALNKAAFTSDPLALNETYALPLQITSANVDSIRGSELDTPTIASKNITILVLKYISPYHGTYYSKGVQYTLDASGATIETVAYSKEDLSQNMTKEFTTLGLNTISTNKIAANISGRIDLTVGDDNKVDIVSTDITVTENSSLYNSEQKTLYMNYKFEASGIMYHAIDTMILRQDPELDLRFEEW